MMKRYRAGLLQLIKKKALRRGLVVLSSGKSANYYLDGRVVTLSSEGAYLVANIILNLIKHKRIVAIGGPTIGADAIVGAVITLASIKGRRLQGVIVRKAPKKHGLQRLIEGPVLSKGSHVVLVDDVVTTGGSLILAKKALDQKGIIVDCAIVIVDREEGARKALAKVNCPLIPIFKKRDILLRS